MAAYCVVLRPRFWTNCGHTRNKRFYLSADDANRAMRMASDDNPEWRVIGVEPGRMTAAPSIPPSPDRPAAVSDSKHAA
jgi:hypothetical protein